MSMFVKLKMLFSLMLILFIVSCNEDSGNNVAGPSNQNNNETGTKQNPFAGRYYGTWYFDDASTVKFDIEFIVDEDYFVTGTLLNSYELEGEVSEDGEIWMSCEFTQSGIQMNYEFDGVVKSSGKSSGDLEGSIDGISGSTSGTWSASLNGKPSSNNTNNNTVFTMPSSVEGTTYRFNIGVTTPTAYEVQFRANGYGTMYSSIGTSFGIKYQYVKKSGKEASVRLWEYMGGTIQSDRYNDFAMTFSTSTSGTCVHTGQSSIGKYGPINGTFERIQ